MGLAYAPDDEVSGVEWRSALGWRSATCSAEVHPQAVEEHLNDEVYWSWDDSGWRGYLQDDYGYWMETDGYGTFRASEGDIPSDLNPELLQEQKELDDAYAAFVDKARTFAQSQTFQRAKGGARGFYPFGKGKGKKGKQAKGQLREGQRLWWLERFI